MEREKKRLIDWLIDGALWVWEFQPTHWHLMVLLLWQVLRYPDDVFLVGVLVVNHIVSNNDSPGPAWNALLSNTWQLMSGITSLWGFTVAWSGCVCVSSHTALSVVFGVLAWLKGIQERMFTELLRGNDWHWAQVLLCRTLAGQYWIISRKMLSKSNQCTTEQCASLL